MKMKLIVSNVLFFLPLITSFKTSYNTVPYTRPAYNTYLTLPWHVHVCPAFPYCTQDLTTGRWYSDPTVSLFGLSNRKIIEKNSINKEIQADFNPRDSDDSFTNCMFEEEYCSTSDSIAKYESDDVESASKCQEYCENNKDCKFWTFLRLRGKTTCSLLPECSAKTKCPAVNKLSCASGPKRCTCPALVKTGGSEEDSKYARWNCGETSYEKELDVGTKCTTTCGNWRNAKNEIIVVESECLLGGDWSTTRDIARQALAYANYYSWSKPSEDDMRCGCDTITVSGYDPNSEEGADFVCEESKDFSGDWQLTTSDQCELYCNKDFAASFECVAGAWAGEPERGFWCYTDPQVEVKVGGCPPGWTQYEANCYKVYDQAMTWTQAQDACQRSASNLASIHLERVNAFLIRLTNPVFTPFMQFHIGGLLDNQTNTWTWADGSRWVYEKWSGGQPSGGGESCLSLNPSDQNGWNDVDCNLHSTYFICMQQFYE